MYRRGRYSEDQLEVRTLVGLARQESSLVPSLTALAKEEAGQTVRSGDPGPQETGGAGAGAGVGAGGEQACFNEESVMHERHERFRPSNL